MSFLADRAPLVAVRLMCALAAFAVASCEPPPPPRVDAATLGPSGAACPDGSTLTYESFGRAFFDRYCQTCHAITIHGGRRRGAPSAITFDDVESIRVRAIKIDETTAAGPFRTNTDMPRDNPVPRLREREELGEWLACGAP